VPRTGLAPLGTIEALPPSTFLLTKYPAQDLYPRNHFLLGSFSEIFFSRNVPTKTAITHTPRIAQPLPNSKAKGDLPLGVGCDWSIVRKLLGPKHLRLRLLPSKIWFWLLLRTGISSSSPSLKSFYVKKVAENRDVRCDDTNVIESVTGRSERDLVKRFDDIDIDWSIIEK
jgi:hypothetical protein